MKITSLADLKAVKKEIEAQALREAAATAQRALVAKQLAARRNLFQAAVGKVARLPHTELANLKPAPPQPKPKQQILDEAAALQEALSDEARETLTAFIREAHRQGIRCVRVVTGKGLGSPGKAPVLKDKVHRWLVQKAEVVAFVQAPPMQGGAGALVVLLQPVRALRAAL